MKSFALLLCPLALMLGCVEVDRDGIQLAPRVPYESSIRSVGQPIAWQGEPLDVDVERGFVEVIGDPDATAIVVTAHAMTWARYGDTENAAAINDAILDTVSVSRADDTIHVRAGVVSDDRGTAEANATQCDVRVVIPAPPGATHRARVHTGLGDAFLQRLTTPPSGALELDVDGFAEGWELHGNLVARAGANDFEITPLAGGFVDVEAQIALAAGIGTDTGATDAKDQTGTILRLPPDFATQSLTLSSNDGQVFTADFPDLSPASASRAGANPAASIRATADWGHVQLFALVPIASRSRTSALGPIETKP